MSSSCLKVTIETFSKLWFSGFKKFITRSVFGSFWLSQISLNFKTSCRNLKIRRLGANYVWLFYYFDFERIYDVLNSKSPCILLNKNINFIKTKQNWKRKISHTVSERENLCFSSYNNHKLKVKLWWVGARKRKKRVFFVPFILFKGFFFKICLLSQCIVY